MAGVLLSDQELKRALEENEFSIEPLDLTKVSLSSKSSPIQPSSIDLHIGNILRPNNHEPGAICRGHILEPGGTIIATTKETLKLGRNISALCFPPAHLTASGIIMTNPGHVDPGYEGLLSFTLINLGKGSMQLNAGQILTTAMVFKFRDNDVECDYSKRKIDVANQTELSAKPDQTIKLLSSDFADTLDRIEKAAERAAKKAVRAQNWLPIIGAVLVAIIGGLSTYLASEQDYTKEIDKIIEEKLKKVRQEFDTEGRLKDTESKIRDLEADLHKLKPQTLTDVKK